MIIILIANSAFSFIFCICIVAIFQILFFFQTNFNFVFYKNHILFFASLTTLNFSNFVFVAILAVFYRTSFFRFAFTIFCKHFIIANKTLVLIFQFETIFNFYLFTFSQLISMKTVITILTSMSCFITKTFFYICFGKLANSC